MMSGLLSGSRGKALLLALPSEPDLSLAMSPADPAAIHEARDALRMRLALHLGEDLKRLHLGLQEAGEFSPDAAGAGREHRRSGTGSRNARGAGGAPRMALLRSLPDRFRRARSIGANRNVHARSAP